jgi:hypothetical protein
MRIISVFFWVADQEHFHQLLPLFALRKFGRLGLSCGDSKALDL